MPGGPSDLDEPQAQQRSHQAPGIKRQLPAASQEEKRGTDWLTWGWVTPVLSHGVHLGSAPED